MDVFLAEPRGFCAGVRRAIAIVEKALKDFGAPVYVRHEIVHNKYVIADLTGKGVVFIEELTEADPNRPVVFSAHGVSREVIAEAERLGLQTIDATCPLVQKVHNQIAKFDQQGLTIIVIGKAKHPEIIGTVGQSLNPGNIYVISTPEDAAALDLRADLPLGFVTQTTLSIDETREIIRILRERFPQIKGMPKADICYATTNRQNAIKALAQKTPNIVVLGSKNSSNSNQLKNTALKNGAAQAWLIDDYQELDWAEIGRLDSIGISAGASAPEYLVDDLLAELKRRYDNIKIQQIIITQENVNFTV